MVACSAGSDSSGAFHGAADAGGLAVRPPCRRPMHQVQLTQLIGEVQKGVMHVKGSA